MRRSRACCAFLFLNDWRVNSLNGCISVCGFVNLTFSAFSIMNPSLIASRIAPVSLLLKHFAASMICSSSM